MSDGFIPCDFPANFGGRCMGHYFEDGQTRGLDYCDGSSDIEHSDGSRIFWDRDGNQSPSCLTVDDVGHIVQPMRKRNRDVPYIERTELSVGTFAFLAEGYDSGPIPFGAPIELVSEKWHEAAAAALGLPEMSAVAAEVLTRSEARWDAIRDSVCRLAEAHADEHGVTVEKILAEYGLDPKDWL